MNGDRLRKELTELRKCLKGTIGRDILIGDLEGGIQLQYSCMCNMHYSEVGLDPNFDSLAPPILASFGGDGESTFRATAGGPLRPAAGAHDADRDSEE